MDREPSVAQGADHLRDDEPHDHDTLAYDLCETCDRIRLLHREMATDHEFVKPGDRFRR